MNPVKIKFATSTFLLIFFYFPKTLNGFIDTCDAKNSCARYDKFNRNHFFEPQFFERETRMVNVRNRVGSERLVNNRRIVDSDSRISENLESRNFDFPRLSGRSLTRNSRDLRQNERTTENSRVSTSPRVNIRLNRDMNERESEIQTRRNSPVRDSRNIKAQTRLLPGTLQRESQNGRYAPTVAEVTRQAQRNQRSSGIRERRATSESRTQIRESRNTRSSSEDERKFPESRNVIRSNEVERIRVSRTAEIRDVRRTVERNSRERIQNDRRVNDRQSNEQDRRNLQHDRRTVEQDSRVRSFESRVSRQLTERQPEEHDSRQRLSDNRNERRNVNRELNKRLTDTNSRKQETRRSNIEHDSRIRLAEIRTADRNSRIRSVEQITELERRIIPDQNKRRVQISRGNVMRDRISESRQERRVTGLDSRESARVAQTRDRRTVEREVKLSAERENRLANERSERRIIDNRLEIRNIRKSDRQEHDTNERRTTRSHEREMRISERHNQVTRDARGSSPNISPAKRVVDINNNRRIGDRQAFKDVSRDSSNDNRESRNAMSRTVRTMYTKNDELSISKWSNLFTTAFSVLLITQIITSSNTKKYGIPQIASFLYGIKEKIY